MDRYGKILASDLEACRQAMAYLIKVDRPIDVYLQQVEDAIRLTQDGKTPSTPTKIVQTEYHSFNKTGLYYRALKEWYKKATSDNTSASFKQVFVEEYHDLVEETKVTNGDASFQSASPMQDIRGALEHLTMAVVADKDIVTKMKEAVETLTRNDASLRTQLRNAMKMNLDMVKELNLKATQAQEPEDKRLKELARKSAAFERNLDPDGYY